MRNLSLLKCVLVFACLASVAGGLGAGERIIRPRRTNRPLPRVFSPVDRNGVGQAPLRTLTPPDSALLPFDLLGEFAGGHGEPARYAPGEADAAQSKNRQEEPERREKKTAAETAPEPEKDPAASAAGPAPFVPYDQYRDMNRSREDFDAPLEITGTFRPSRSSAPDAGRSPLRREIGGAGETLPAPEIPETEAPETVETVEAEMAALPEVEPEPSLPPAPEEVESYRRRLEQRLLERYNNLPEHSGEVAKVMVVLSKPLQPSLDGTRLRAEFDQLVFDTWGKRIPSLEKEYYVVTFGSGGVRQVRSDPSIRVGLNLERTYSEPGPDSDIGEKIRRLPSDHAFRAAPAADAAVAKMPDWWRPEFADDGY